MKRAVFHPEAGQEYLAAIEYYAAIRLELGERFDSEIQQLVGEVSRDPQRFFRFHPPAQRALSSVQRGQPLERILLKKPYLRYLSTRKSLVIKEAFLSIFRKVGVFQQNQKGSLSIWPGSSSKGSAIERFIIHLTGRFGFEKRFPCLARFEWSIPAQSTMS